MEFYFDENYVEVSQKPFEITENFFKLPFVIDDHQLHYMPITFYDIPTYAQIDTAFTIKDQYHWTLGGQTLNQLPRLNFGKTNRDLVLGNRIFRDHYNLIIQTSAEKVYALSPRQKPSASTTDKEFGYFVLKMDQKLKIVQIISNDNTVKYGLNLMDEILELNGNTADDFKDNYSIIKLQRDLQKANKALHLKLKNGNIIELMIQSPHSFEFKNNLELWNL